MEIRPQRGPQEVFLATPADIAIGGGTAGWGKTWSLIVEPLRHVHNPDFGAVIFRRTNPQIVAEGGLWDETQKIYPLLGARPYESPPLHYDFSAGSTITLSHLQHDKSRLDWQGSQIPLICWDELTHFSAKQFWYLLSRNRSVCGVRPYVRGTVNPEPGWVADLLDWWIDDEGWARPERSGVVRWFVREGGELHWADEPDSLKRRFPGSLPKSLTFVLGTVYDNRILLEKDPGYLANLQALPYVDRMRLLGDPERPELGGNWKIKPAAGKVFNRAWFEILAAAPASGIDCRFWDLAATVKEMEGEEPSFTAGMLVRRVGGFSYFMDCYAEQVGPAGADAAMRNLAAQDAQRAEAAGAKYRVRWEREGGASGKRDSARIAAMLSRYDAKGVRPQGDKLTRAKPLAAQSEAGNVKLVAGAWNERWLEHMHNQPDWPFNDIMDASSGAYNDTAGGTEYQKPGVVQYA